jgi:hypothetical protein
MLTKSAIMQRMKLFILRGVTSQLRNKFKEGLRGSKVESNKQFAII